jgi:hypothetical protein
VLDVLFFQTLPVFLDSLVTAWGAIVISVTLILLFGEVSFLSWGQVYVWINVGCENKAKVELSEMGCNCL